MTIKKNHETISDIVAEMRNTRFYEQTSETTTHWVREYADRIEAAYKRLAIPTPEQWTEFARQGSELEELKKRLRKIYYALSFDSECGSCGAYTIDEDDYRDGWFDNIGLEAEGGR